MGKAICNEVPRSDAEHGCRHHCFAMPDKATFRNTVDVYGYIEQVCSCLFLYTGTHVWNRGLQLVKAACRGVFYVRVTLMDMKELMLYEGLIIHMQKLRNMGGF